MKLKVTNNISYLEAKKLHENKPETTFSKIVQSIARPEMKDASTLYVIGRIVVIVVSDVFTSECNRTYCSYCSFRRFYVSQYLNIPRQALIALYYG